MAPDVEKFVGRWSAREGGAERANYQMFLAELCDVIGVARPEPAGAERGHNDYVFERAVRPRESDGGTTPKRIDLYKRGCFILEAKQSRLPGKKNAIPGQLSLIDEAAAPSQAQPRAGWDVMMQNARKQAETYVFLLDSNHAAPPFLIVADVGNCFEVYADFSGTGRAYGHFPDRKSFRIFLEDLRKPEIRDRLATIWTDPQSLDPTQKAARVTREIAKRLAAVSKALEAEHEGQAERIAHFLMRCIFTMFAEDVDLLPKGKFTELLEDCAASPDGFASLLDELWSKMNEPESAKRFSAALRAHVRHFNGNLFEAAKAYPLKKEEIGELLAASRMDWREVDPAIFGTLLEQALDPAERKKLGAHYTPRAYVQRLVDVTVMEPLRADWQAALTKAEAAKDEGDGKRAVAIVRGFLKELCATRVLDPACGTGNFLYVALELMKRLEGDVLETLARLGETEDLGFETVDPHQFLGLELNPRAAAIAELVVWIGYLQQHYRAHDGHPDEPILRAFKNINFGRREGYDAVLTWDGYPLPTVVEKEGKRVETFPNAKRPAWPDAEFIVGNPPFIRGSELRQELGDTYAKSIWSVYDYVPGGADFVMLWWDQAANFMGSGTKLRRFGLVTTNKIAQGFSREVVEHHLVAKNPISIVWAIDDHPWYSGPKGTAQVRIAMTVAERGKKDGRLHIVKSEENLNTDEPTIAVEIFCGLINPDLTVGVDTTRLPKLVSNIGCSFDGVKLHGKGFIISPRQAESLGLGVRPFLEKYVKIYKGGMDLKMTRKRRMVIDMFGLTEKEIRSSYPEIYQQLLIVKDERQRVIDRIKAKGREPSKDLVLYRESWWIFGKPRPELRPAIEGLNRFIGTIDTAKHRFFQFLPTSELFDDGVVYVCTEDASILSILSSNIHVLWANRTGGWLGVGNDPRWNKSVTFDPFPFPDPPEPLRQKLREAGEELDATRKRVQAEHTDITLTGLYNVLEKIKADAALSPKDDDVKRRGLVLILKELHETVDRLAFEAYGWPQDLTAEQILERLVTLNAERAREEAAGKVRWLRPDYQIPRFDKGLVAKTGELTLPQAAVAAAAAGLPAFPSDPYEQPLAVEAALAAAGRPMAADDLAKTFKGRPKTREARIAQVLGTLTRYGRVTALLDGRYAARRAA